MQLNKVNMLSIEITKLCQQRHLIDSPVSICVRVQGCYRLLSVER